MAKNGCAQSGLSTLKLIVSQELNMELTDLLHADTISHKLKSD